MEFGQVIHSAREDTLEERVVLPAYRPSSDPLSVAYDYYDYSNFIGPPKPDVIVLDPLDKKAVEGVISKLSDLISTGHLPLPIGEDRDWGLRVGAISEYGQRTQVYVGLSFSF